MPSHLGVKSNEKADEGRLQHPNNLLPLSKRRWVSEWDELCLEPRAESEGQQVTSNVDSGGGESCCARSDEGLSDSGVRYSSNSEGVRGCSAQTSVTRGGGVGRGRVVIVMGC